MAMLSFTSTSTAKVSSQMISYESSNTSNHLETRLKNVSFSSYSSIDDETFMRKLADTSQNMVTAQEDHLSSGRKKKEEDGELRVFGAEKYFNGRMDEESPKQQLQQYKKQERTDMIQSMKPISSAQSESSWNSQSALLQSVMRNKAKKARAKSLLGSLSCKCVCSDKDSVDIVEDYVGEISFSNKSSIKTVPEHGIGQNKDKCFSLANSSHGEPNLPAKKMQFQLEEDQKARKSLEVFGSSAQDKRNKSSFSIGTRLAKLSWEANPRLVLQEEIDFGDHGGYNNESGSDASSDLFEIESLTGKSNPFVAREVPSGCATPTTCYAPSEASIEWSVVTASAADFSVLSDSEEQRAQAMSSPCAIGAKMKPRKGIAQRRRPNILLSCKSHKSVRVAGDAYIATDKVHADHSPRTRHGSDPMTPLTRFQGGNKMQCFDSRQQHGLAKHQLARSHSPRASHLLYIQ